MFDHFVGFALQGLKGETFVNNDRRFENICGVSIKVLNKHTPIKKKYGNQMPFVTKDLSKVTMKSET